jgi:hypothetical protein
MVVQITLARDELILIKELLPVWKKYSDGFVFMLDTNTDGTKEYLESVKEKYNILEILETTESENSLKIETDLRQLLFDTGFKYSNKIICLDADEYLDGNLSKLDLEKILEDDLVIFLDWVQYTSCNTIRTDGVWKNNTKDRIGSYKSCAKFAHAQMHSTHLPMNGKSIRFDRNQLFVAHLAWLDKTHVAIKQYYWKTVDYITRTKFKEKTASISDYDASVNNFEWEEQYVNYPLKVNQNIFKKIDLTENYKLKSIIEYTEKYQIPNLGSWGHEFKKINLDNNNKNIFDISVVTGIGDLKIYEKFIDRYINNVKQQHSFLNTEHIIIYKEWSEKFNYIKNHENFKLIKETGAGGVYNAWNTGIKNSTTNFITNWNIDDLRHPINNKLKYDLLTKNPQYDVAYNYYVATTELDENFDNLKSLADRNILKFPDEYEKYCTSACMIGPDPMWKKSLHADVGYFDQENFSCIGDWEMWIRFAKTGAKFKLIPHVLCMYYDHEKTVSKINTKNGTSIQQEKKLRELYDK